MSVYYKNLWNCKPSWLWEYSSSSAYPDKPSKLWVTKSFYRSSYQDIKPKYKNKVKDILNWKTEQFGSFSGAFRALLTYRNFFKIQLSLFWSYDTLNFRQKYQKNLLAISLRLCTTKRWMNGQTDEQSQICKIFPLVVVSNNSKKSTSSIGFYGTTAA